MKSSRGFLLKRHSFTKLQSSKKLWSTYCTPTAHELALSSLNSSSPVCSMMHGGGEYSYTTINQELDHVFLLFPQRRCGFLFGTWSAKKTTVTAAAIIKQKSYKERCKSLRTFGTLQDLRRY